MKVSLKHHSAGDGCGSDCDGRGVDGSGVGDGGDGGTGGSGGGDGSGGGGVRQTKRFQESLSLLHKDYAADHVISRVYSLLHKDCAADHVSYRSVR